MNQKGEKKKDGKGKKKKTYNSQCSLAVTDENSRSQDAKIDPETYHDQRPRSMTRNSSPPRDGISKEERMMLEGGS